MKQAQLGIGQHTSARFLNKQGGGSVFIHLLKTHGQGGKGSKTAEAETEEPKRALVAIVVRNVKKTPGKPPLKQTTAQRPTVKSPSQRESSAQM